MKYREIKVEIDLAPCWWGQGPSRMLVAHVDFGGGCREMGEEEGSGLDHLVTGIPLDRVGLPLHRGMPEAEETRHRRLRVLRIMLLEDLLGVAHQ